MIIVTVVGLMGVGFYYLNMTINNNIKSLNTSIHMTMNARFDDIEDLIHQNSAYSFVNSIVQPAIFVESVNEQVNAVKYGHPCTWTFVCHKNTSQFCPNSDNPPHQCGDGDTFYAVSANHCVFHAGV